MTRSVASARTIAITRQMPSASLYFTQTGPAVVASNSILAGLTSFCIECFVMTPKGTSSGSTGRIIDFGLSGISGFAGFSPGSSNPIIKINTTQSATAPSFSLKTWHHLAFSYDGSNMRTFVDGVLGDTTALAATTLGTTNGNFFIGNNGIGNNRGTEGFIQDLRVSNTARYTSSFTPPSAQHPVDANTLLLYRLNEFRGTSALDSSSNALTATLSGSPLPSWQPGDPNITINYPGTPRQVAGTRSAA